MAERAPKQPRQRHTHRNIIRDLRKISNVNADFRDGESDYMKIHTEQTEEVHASDMLHPVVDGRWPTPYFSETFTFEADRRPREHGVTSYNAVYIGSLNNIKMPEHIARDAYGLSDGREAVENAGPSIASHAVRVMIDTADRHLTVCELFDYEDDEGDVVLSTCGCKPDDTWEGDEAVHDEDDTALHLHDIGERGDLAMRPDAAKHMESLRHPVNGLISDDDLLTLERSALIMESVGIDDPMNDIIKAKHVIYSLRKAFKKQLGVDI